MNDSKTLKKINALWLALGIFQLILIIYGCLFIPPKNLQNSFFSFDKLIHISIYIIISWWWIQLPKINIYLLGLSFLLFSIAIEIIQPFFNRSFEYFDIIANFSGIIIGLFIFYYTNINLLEFIKRKLS